MTTTTFADPDDNDDDPLISSEMIWLINDALGRHRDYAPFIDDAVKVLVARYERALYLLAEFGVTEADVRKPR